MESTRALRVVRAAVRVGLALLVVLVGVAARWRATGRPPFVDLGRNAWALAMVSGPSPFELAPVGSAPAFTGGDVTDKPSWFAADPFLLRRDGVWNLFFESLTKDGFQGDIGLATSRDGAIWEYQQIVLDEPWHLSFPLVFEHGGEVYMVPESVEKREVRLYRATDFPTKWALVKPLVTDRDLLDPVVFEADGRWYMFASVVANDTLYLLTAPALTGPWTDHPASPVVRGDLRRARPAGRVVVAGGKRYRLAQDCDGDYGKAVRAVEILELTPTSYREAEALPAPFLEASGRGWNRRGMHHADLHLLDGRWWAAVDGRGEYVRWGTRYW